MVGLIPHPVWYMREWMRECDSVAVASVATCTECEK
jgi:hypothetical protein